MIELSHEPKRSMAATDCELKSDDACAARTKLTRHDAHNLELKIFYETPSLNKKISLDLYLFMPASLHLGICDKADLIRDFHSRLRLSNTASFSFSSVDHEIQSIKHEIERWSMDMDFDERDGANERIFRTARHIGAVLGEALKAKAATLTKAIFLPHSLLVVRGTPRKRCSMWPTRF